METTQNYTDSELLVRAGNAINLDFFRVEHSGLYIRIDGDDMIWNSLKHDEDAIQLSRELKLTAIISDDLVRAGITGETPTVAVKITEFTGPAWREAITRVAASMGRGDGEE